MALFLMRDSWNVWRRKVDNAIGNHISASDVSYDNTGTGLVATTVQAGITELNTNKADSADLGTASAKDSTDAVTQNSTDLVESGAVYSAISDTQKIEDITLEATSSDFSLSSYSAKRIGKLAFVIMSFSMMNAAGLAAGSSVSMTINGVKPLQQALTVNFVTQNLPVSFSWSPNGNFIIGNRSATSSIQQNWTATCYFVFIINE